MNSTSNQSRIARERTLCFVNELNTLADKFDQADHLPISVVRRLGELGLIGLGIPTEFGGAGLGAEDRLNSIEQIAACCPAVGATLQIAQLGTSALVEFGTSEQRAKWLPRLAGGNQICTIAITERDSGSHVDACETTYQREGNDLILNGSKWCVGNAGIADYHVLYAREHSSASYAAILVESERRGVDCGNRLQTMGLPAFYLGQIELRAVRVPISNVLGGLGRGRAVIHKVVGRHGRLGVSAVALGIHQKLYDRCYQFASQRELYGAPIARLPDIKSKLFEIYRLIECSRALAYRAAAAEDASEPGSGRLLALSKYQSIENLMSAMPSAMQIFGARANLPECGIAQLQLDAIMMLAPSGTSDVLRKRIVDDLTGLRPIGWPADEQESHSRCVGMGAL